MNGSCRVSVQCEGERKLTVRRKCTSIVRVRGGTKPRIRSLSRSASSKPVPLLDSGSCTWGKHARKHSQPQPNPTMELSRGKTTAYDANSTSFGETRLQRIEVKCAPEPLWSKRPQETANEIVATQRHTKQRETPQTKAREKNSLH